jgi:hypothetical protein
MRSIWGKAVWSQVVWSKAVWGAAVALWLMAPAPGWAAGRAHGNKVDRFLAPQSSKGSQHVIIRTKANADLAADPDVESISAGARITASQLSSLNDTTDNLLDSLSEVKATLGLSGILSELNVTIAVIDSGLAPGVDFEGRGTYGAAFDDYGHGTP